MGGGGGGFNVQGGWVGVVDGFMTSGRERLQEKLVGMGQAIGIPCSGKHCGKPVVYQTCHKGRGK